jgi:signal transduction histidine kinase
MALADLSPTPRHAVAPRRLDGDEPVLFGVAAAVARRLDLDPLSVRAAFVVMTVAGGWGALLYLGLWATLVWRQPRPERRQPSLVDEPTRRLGLLAGVVGVLLVLRDAAPGFHDELVWPVALVATLAVVGWRRFGFDALGGATATGAEGKGHLVRAAGGGLLVIGGFAYLDAANLPVGALRDGLVAIAVVLSGVLLVAAPWVLQLTRSLADERRERIRADERAEVAIHLHDSVLQTLTLLQKRSDDPQQMAALARHQERELRRWLYGTPDGHDGRGFREAIEAMVAEVEDQHLVQVDNVTVGDGPVEPIVQTVISAAREALVNAAKFSGERRLSLYAELRPGHVEMYVRDRGQGFRLEDVAPDRKGISDSIVGRLDRLGGTADVRTAPGAGTEVRLRVELAA